jgi:enoyl-CoA hydratase/carnithine racemase
VQYDCTDRIARIGINRPAKLNAFSDGVVRQLVANFERFDHDSAADVAILFGHGRAFSSGVDVQQGQLRSREELARSQDPMGLGAPCSDLFMRSVNWKPVVAAVHGYALGLALGVVLQCDLVVAEEGTRFQITETPRGLGGYRHWALLKQRGTGTFADDVSLTGRFFTAEEALAAGVITKLAPKGACLAAASELAAVLAKNPPLSVRETVRIRRWHMSQFAREVAFQTAPVKLELTEDFAESARAFAEKRAPAPFKGR